MLKRQLWKIRGRKLLSITAHTKGKPLASLFVIPKVYKGNNCQQLSDYLKRDFMIRFINYVFYTSHVFLNVVLPSSYSI